MDWFENDEFWMELYPLMFPKERMEKAETEVESALALADKSVRTALDLCCGPGRHAIALAKRGVQVTAVDRTSLYLAKGEEAASREDVVIEWVQADMREFVRPDAFDLVLNMFTSFGYFEDPNDNLRVLANMHQSLRAGGTLVLDLVGKECIAANFEETGSIKDPDGTVFVERRRICDDWERIDNEWFLIRGEEVKAYRFQHTIYSGVELRDRLLQTGFRTVRLLSDLEGTAYGWGAKRLVVVALK
jgi:SAM-dependent methyltransferase